MIKKIGTLLLFFSCFFLIACSKDKVQKQAQNFDLLMGKKLEAWKYVRTQEDFANLEFFRSLYEKNRSLIDSPSNIFRIPKVLHFIWLGPKPFPKESIENIRSWISFHPDWTITLWSDRERPLPHKKMKLRLVQDLSFFQLFDCYDHSENYGEKSNLLRYEILYQEGGLYVDHDIQCFKSFATLHQTYDLYAGLELPSPSILSSSIVATNSLIGVRAGHPVMKECMNWLSKNWKEFDRNYPGRDKDSLVHRVMRRSFSAFGEALKTAVNSDGNQDIIFPAFYFNAPEDKLSLFSRHLKAELWFDSESSFEKSVKERLNRIIKKSNNILLFFAGFAMVNSTAFAILLLKKKKNRETTLK